MRRLAFLVAALLLATTAAGETVRTLEHAQPAGALTAITVTAGVGEVEILGDSGNEVRVRVEVKAKRTGLFGSRMSSQEIEGLAIEHAVAGGTLSLRVTPERHDDRNFSETWRVYVPSALAASVKLGVGDVTVLDMAGDVRAELGVGDVKIEGAYAVFGNVEATSGVGDASLRTPEDHTEGAGFIGHHLTAQGPGKAAIRAEVGVGDATIRLR